MFQKIFHIIIFLLICGHASSQLSVWQEKVDDRQEIVFDTSGKMISYPGTFVTANARFKFAVKTPPNIYAPWLSKLRSSLKGTREMLEEAEIANAYACLFKNEAEYANFLNVLDKLISIRDTCDTKELLKLVNQFQADSILPVKMLIRNAENQYKVRIYKNDICIDSVFLTLGDNCGNGCTEFAAYRNISETCVSCVASPNDQLRFELIHIDPWDKTIRDWYTKQAGRFPKDKAKLQLITDALRTISNDSVSADNFVTELANLGFLNTWFLRWFWLTGGNLSVDIFNLPNKAGRKKINADIAERDAQMAACKEQLIFLDSVKLATPKRLGQLDSTFKEAQVQQQAIRKQLEKLGSERADLEKLLKPGRLYSSVSSNSMLYQGRMQLSKSFFAFNKRSVNPHKQFDAFVNYQPVALKTFQRRKVIEIPENERLYITIHNIPQNVIVKVDERRLAFDDQEEFTKLVSEQLSKIDFTSLGAATVQNLEAFVKSLASPTGLEIKGAALKNDSCKKYLQPLLKSIAMLVNVGFVTFPPDASLFEEVGTSGPLFRTQLAPITAFETPFRDSITIKAIYSKDSSVDVAKTYVKVGKLRFIQLLMGIAVTKDPVAITKIDTAGGGFQVSRTDNGAKAIFGFKIYPFKNYNRDNGIVPRYPLRRFSVMAGAELLRPLNNFYLGASYDVLPGLAVATGSNYYLETRYRVENNVITNTSRSYQKSGAYYSISVNPVLFVQFVKLFFKTL